VRWDVISAEPEFFRVTKTLHNFLQGRDGFSPSMIKLYWDTLEKNKDVLDKESDVIIIHDPQPLGLIKLLSDEVRRNKKVIWRCHVHLETIPLAKMKDIEFFLRSMVESYDAAIFSTFQYLPLWNVVSFVIPPFIDPLSEKNRELSREEIEKVLNKYGLDPEKPLITQVSRFDRFKDPLGVIAAFKKVREKIPCQLLLVGGGASDDPEYQEVLAEAKRAAEGHPDIHILDLPPDSHKEINAFQRASSVIVQKSIKEGFGLTVTEALWKAKPVVAGAVGGHTAPDQRRVERFLGVQRGGDGREDLLPLEESKSGRGDGEEGKGVREGALPTAQRDKGLFSGDPPTRKGAHNVEAHHNLIPSLDTAHSRLIASRSTLDVHSRQFVFAYRVKGFPPRLHLKSYRHRVVGSRRGDQEHGASRGGTRALGLTGHSKLSVL